VAARHRLDRRVVAGRAERRARRRAGVEQALSVGADQRHPDPLLLGRVERARRAQEPGQVTAVEVVRLRQHLQAGRGLEELAVHRRARTSWTSRARASSRASWASA
jgi:hypothetical protein